jgi:hypothetical protein
MDKYTVSDMYKDLLSWQEFHVGDIVSRDGTDEHIVENVWRDGQMIEVRCIKEPEDKWIEVGETESNLARRYKKQNTHS